ncbi:twin-arginine translocation pathway signal protein [Blastomonas sp.]|uniref:twin-arginine translocation pathway signal protein n=1 Tax=Blastomonas sp. TaxID=1909299 RepID=UPI00391B9DE0
MLATMAVTGANPALAQASREAEARPSFVPADFDVPTLVETPGFKLVPLGPELVDIDFAAYMSSIEHLQQTFTRSTDWPHKDVSAADAMKDMQTEQARFERRTSFAYAVLTPDGKRERGCVYVYPSEVPGYDAVVTMWVTKAEHDAGFDAELYAWAKDWVAKEWPFAKVAYPGRSIAWADWDAMVAAK